MRSAPTRRTKPAPVWLRVVQWILGLAAAAAILAGVVALAVGFFAPDLGAEVREATVEVEDVLPAADSPTGRPIPIVTLEKEPTWLRVAPASSGGEVVPGTRVHVVYEWLPATTSCRVLSWEPVGPPDVTTGG